MTRQTVRGTVRWSFRIEKETYERFQSLHPQGTTSELVRIALELFLGRVETDPALLKWSREDIQRKLYDERIGPDRQHVPVHVPLSLHERFMVLFPDFGATTWFLTRIYRSYLDIAPPIRDLTAQALEAIYTREVPPISSLPDAAQ